MKETRLVLQEKLKDPDHTVTYCEKAWAKPTYPHLWHDFDMGLRVFIKANVERKITIFFLLFKNLYFSYISTGS